MGIFNRSSVCSRRYARSEVPRGEAAMTRVTRVRERMPDLLVNAAVALAVVGLSLRGSSSAPTTEAPKMFGDNACEQSSTCATAA